MRLLLAVAGLALAGLLATGCESGRSDPPNATIRVIHAAPNVGPVTFRRVRVNATTIDYLASAVFSFDVDTYTFNLEILSPSSSVAQTISLEHTLSEGTDYALVLREVGGQPDARVIETAKRSAGASNTQLQLIHTATTLGAVDVFVEPSGFDLATATPWATVSFDGVSTPREIDAGSYEFVVTEAGNRANVLLASDPIAVSGSQHLYVLLADGANQSLAPITLTVAQDTGVQLVDKDLSAGMRVLNAVSDQSAIDAGIDLELSPPLVAALPFGTVSDLVTISPEEHDFNVTPAGNPGVIETEETFNPGKASIGTWFVTGAPGSLSALLLEDDFRVLSGESKLRVFQGSVANADVNVFVVTRGTDTTNRTPTTALPTGTASANLRVTPGNYEVTIREPSTSTILAGPAPITIAAEGYYGILLSDPPGGSGVDLTFLYDFN